MDLEVYLVYVAIVLLLGTLSSALAYQLKTSNVFFLILTGMIFGSLGMIQFPASLVITISTIALILVIFDSANKFEIRDFLRNSIDAGTLSLIFLIFNIFFTTIAAHFLFDMNILLAMLFSSLVYGIDPMIALVMLKGKNSKTIRVLKIEAIINTPLTIIIPFLILSLIKENTFEISEVSSQFVPFIQQIILGIGIGVIIGGFVVIVLKHNFMGDLSHLTLLSAAIICYVFAEYIEGNGVLAITAFGLIFGNTKLHHKVALENFASIFSYTLEILVFILMGTYLIIQPEYILKGTLLFFIYIITRFGSVYVSFPKIGLSDKIFMTLNVPKGIDVAVIVLLLISQYNDITGMAGVINLSLLFILYSIVLSTVVGAFSENLFKNVIFPKKSSS